jgi:hypothetical protein
VVARRAHNPKVVGSNPTPATKTSEAEQKCSAFLFVQIGRLTFGVGQRVGFLGG